MEKDFWHVEIIELENIDILIHKFEDILTFDSSTSHKIDLTVLNNSYRLYRNIFCFCARVTIGTTT